MPTWSESVIQINEWSESTHNNWFRGWINLNMRRASHSPDEHSWPKWGVINLWKINEMTEAPFYGIKEIITWNARALQKLWYKAGNWNVCLTGSRRQLLKKSSRWTKIRQVSLDTIKSSNLCRPKKAKKRLGTSLKEVWNLIILSLSDLTKKNVNGLLCKS